MSAAQMATAAAQLAAAAASNVEKMHTELADKIAQAVTEKMAADLGMTLTSQKAKEKAAAEKEKAAAEKEKAAAEAEATT
jgi:hypothetical protein